MAYCDLSEYNDEYRIVLIGKTGAGKSATGNSLISNKIFAARNDPNSVTRKCEKGYGYHKSKKLVVVDTPGLFDTNKSDESTVDEIMKCIGITSPGPHVVVMVIGLGRQTAEELNTIDSFLTFFGKDVLNYMIVLFTRLDDLEHDGTTLEKWVEKAPYHLNQVLSRCGNRYLGFNNRAEGDDMEKQLEEFFSNVREIVEQNGNSCYTNDMYKEVEALLQRRMKELEKNQYEMRERKSRAIEMDYHQRVLEPQYAQMKINLANEIRQQVRDEIDNNKGGIISKLKSLWSRFKNWIKI